MGAPIVTMEQYNLGLLRCIVSFVRISMRGWCFQCFWFVFSSFFRWFRFSISGVTVLLWNVQPEPANWELRSPSHWLINASDVKRPHPTRPHPTPPRKLRKGGLEIEAHVCLANGVCWVHRYQKKKKTGSIIDRISIHLLELAIFNQAVKGWKLMWRCLRKS